MCASSRVLMVLVTLFVSLSGVSPVLAQQPYPSRTIKMIIPFPPGGPTDLFARLFAPRLGEVLGQNVVTENRAGAGGNIGIDAAAKSAPDGYTMVFGTGSIATGAAIYKSLPYDPRKDIEPVALVGVVPLVLLAAPNMPGTPAELIAEIRRSPGKHSFGSAGNGTTTHLAGEMLKARASIDVVHVPYKGSGPAIQDTIAGRLAFLFETPSATKAFTDSGQLKLVAVSTAKRSPLLPNLPSLAESGVPGLAAYTWNMLFVPAGTPKAVIDRLQRASNQVLADSTLAGRLANLGVEVVSDSTPESARTFLLKELDVWADVVKTAGVKVE